MDWEKITRWQTSLFTEPVMIVLTIMSGLIFGMTTYNLGWFLASVIILELTVRIMIGKRYNLVFRCELNCIFFLTVIYSNWIFGRTCMFDEILYGIEVKDNSMLSIICNTCWNKLEKLLT